MVDGADCPIIPIQQTKQYELLGAMITKFTRRAGRPWSAYATAMACALPAAASAAIVSSYPSSSTESHQAFALEGGDKEVERWAQHTP